MRLSKRLGSFMLGIYLIAQGCISLLHFSFTGMDIVMAVLAIVAGLLILLGR
jgi:hypothetical protein